MANAYKDSGDTLVLELSREEARTLTAIFSKVGGDPVLSPRKHSKAMSEAMFPHAGGFRGLEESDLGVGHIPFKNYPAPKSEFKEHDAIRFLSSEGIYQKIDDDGEGRWKSFYGSMPQRDILRFIEAGKAEVLIQNGERV